MKKFILLVLFAFMAHYTTYADTTIQMEKYKGVYRIPCTLNGAKMKLVFDTGASCVAISLNMAEYLCDNGYLTDNDLISTGEAKIADGSIVDHIRINIRDLEIGGIHLYNIEAVVLNALDSPLLLGQTALSQLGNYSISENKLIIHDSSEITSVSINNVSVSPLDKNDTEYELFMYGKKLYEKEIYYEAINVFADQYYRGVLCDEGKLYYAASKYFTKDYDRAIELALEIRDFSWWKPNGLNPYILLGASYGMSEDYQNGIYKLQEGMARLNYGSRDLFVSYELLATMYYNLEDYGKCIKEAWKAIDYYAKYVNLTRESVWKKCTGTVALGNIKEKAHLDNTLWCLVNAHELNNLWTFNKAENTRKILARKGFDSFVQYCISNNIKY